jgi:hypothetical protein
MGATLKAGFATLPVNVLAYGCWLRLQHNRIVIVARITPVSSSKARRLYTRFRYSCSGISPRTFRSPLTPILKHTQSRLAPSLAYISRTTDINVLQYSDSVEVLSGLSDHDLSESQRLVSTMGIEPTNYRCDTGRAMLAIHRWIRLALSFHVVFIDTILEHTD